MLLTIHLICHKLEQYTCSSPEIVPGCPSLSSDSAMKNEAGAHLSTTNLQSQGTHQPMC